MMARAGRGSARNWDYDTGEIVADGVIHGLGVVLAIAGFIVLIALDLGRDEADLLGSHTVYGLSLLITLAVSAAYNLWPVSPLKWQLRRLDHAMIFGLIAGTYTPFLVHAGRPETTALLVAIWLVALAGMVVKAMAFEGREWLSTALYIALGWSGVLVIGSIVQTMPTASLVLLVIGGLLYSGGVAFHHWRSLRFQNAIWHGFVLAGAVTHFVAVLVAIQGP